MPQLSTTETQGISVILDSAEANIERAAMLLLNPSALTLDKCLPLLAKTAAILESLRTREIGKEWRERFLTLQGQIQRLDRMLDAAQRFYSEIAQAVGRVYSGYTSTGRSIGRYPAGRIAVDL